MFMGCMVSAVRACNLTLAKRFIYYTLGIECAIERFVTMFLRCDLVWAYLIFNLRYNRTTFMEIQYFRIFQHPFIQCMAVDSHTRS